MRTNLLPGGDFATETFGDYQNLQTAAPAQPISFQVVVSPDREHYQFIVGDVMAGNSVPIREFRVYFADAALLAPGQDINGYDAQTPPVLNYLKMFKAAVLVGSVSSPGKGGVVAFYDRQFVGKPGWFFAVAVSNAGTESLPTPPVSAGAVTVFQGTGNFTKGSNAVTGSGFADAHAWTGAFLIQGSFISTISDNTTTTITMGTPWPNATGTYTFSVVSSVADATVPPDVVGPQAELIGENVNGVPMVRVVVSAQMPSPAGSFYGYQIYLWNYRADNRLREGPTFYAGSATSGAISGSFLESPDIPKPYTTGTIAVPNNGAASLTTVTGTGTNWSQSWGSGSGRKIAYVAPNASGVSTLYNRDISGVTGPTTLTFMGPNDNVGSSGLPYAITGPSTNDYGASCHPVRVYFIAISPAGTRRPDPLNAPYIEFPFGLGASMSAPIQPSSVTVTLTSSTVNLGWTIPSIDTTVDRFNIYRRRNGTYGTAAYNARPAAPYAVVPYDRAANPSGRASFIDRTFNIDPTVAATTDPTGWDFDTTDPAAYSYWITSVNTEGTENLVVFAGQLTSAGATTLTYSAGDAFSQAYVGQTVQVAGVSRTILAATPAKLTVNAPVAPAGTYEFTVGPATGRVVLLGNVGTQDDISIYRDNFNQRLFNSQFIADSNVALSKSANQGYGATIYLPDGQPTFEGFYSQASTTMTGLRPIQVFRLYGIGLTGKQTITAAPLPNPTAGYGSLNADSSFGCWQYTRTTGGGTIPKFGTGLGGDSNGTIVLDPTTNGASASDAIGIWQQIKTAKFLPGENLVFTFYAMADSGTQDTLIRVQMTRFDALDYFTNYGAVGAANGIERDATGGDISTSQLTSDYQRFTVMGNLGNANPTPISGGSCMILSPTVTGAGFTTGNTWVGCSIFLTDGVNNFSSYIKTVNNAGQLTMTQNCSFTGTGTVTVIVGMVFTHYVFKISLVGASNGANKIVRITKPMVNGGRIGAVWTPILQTDDQPGADAANGGTATDIIPVACIIHGTDVQTPGGSKKAEDVRVGDVLLSRDYMGLKTGTVTHLHPGSTTAVYYIRTRNFRLGCSHDHAVGVMKGGRVSYVYAEDIRCNDKLICTDGSRIVIEPVDAITTSLKSTPVYTFTVTPHHNYFAGGILSKNRKPVRIE